MQWAGLHRRRPPGWQLYLLLGLYPVLWVLGLAYFVWPVAAGVFILSLCLRGNIRIPPGFGLWVLFLIWMTASVIELSTGTQVMLFVWRALIYLTATGLFLWVYNSSADELPSLSVAQALTVLWAAAVIGGLGGVIDPAFSYKTLAERLAPGSILSNSTAHSYIHVALAQIQFKALGRPIGRPIALFAYTNQWAATVGMLTPFAIITAMQTTRPLVRKAVFALLGLSTIAIVVSINRGLWIALALAAAYVGIRLAAAGRTKLLIRGTAVCVVLAVAIVVSPLGSLIHERVSSSHNSNGTRSTLYGQTFAGVSSSPLFGFGSPRASTTLVGTAKTAVGTQGQFYLVLYSHGYPGLVFYLGWFAYTLLATLRRRTVTELLWGSVIVISFAEMMVYDFLPVAIYIVMIACALLWRQSLLEREAVPAATPPLLPAPATPPGRTIAPAR